MNRLTGRRLRSRRWINNRGDFADITRGVFTLADVRDNDLFRFRQVDTIDFIRRHETVDPLNLRTHTVNDLAKTVCDPFKFIGIKQSRIRYKPFNYVFRHKIIRPYSFGFSVTPRLL